MKTKLSVIIFSLALCFAFVGCGGGSGDGGQAESEPAEILDLSGTWIQTNSNSEDTWHEATIEGDVIEIYWVSNGGDTRDLYWAGTYAAPTEPGDTYSWTSENDREKTDVALLASTSDTKEFTYENGELVYEASAMGSDMTIRLEQQE